MKRHELLIPDNWTILDFIKWFEDKHEPGKGTSIRFAGKKRKNPIIIDIYYLIEKPNES